MNDAEKFGPTVDCLTSITFTCNDGFLIDKRSLGSQATTISFRSRKLIQRFFLKGTKDKSIAKFKYSLSKEQLAQIKDLLAESDCFHWAESLRGNRRTNGWSVKFRVGKDLEISGIYQPPHGIMRLEDYLRAELPFSYPLMLALPSEINYLESTLISDYYREFLDGQDALEEKTTFVEAKANEFLAHILDGGLGDLIVETWQQRGLDFIGNFIADMMLLEADPKLWDPEIGYKYGENELCPSLEFCVIYLEDAVKIIGMLQNEMKKEHLTTKEKSVKLVDSIVEGYLVHCGDHDHLPRSMEAHTKKVANFPSGKGKVVSLKAKKAEKDNQLKE